MKKKLLSLLLALILCLGLAAPAAAAAAPELTFLTEAVYDYIVDLSEGLMWAQQGSAIRYINESGSVVIADALAQLRTYLGGEPDMYRVWVGDFHEGLARILYYDEDFAFIEYAYFIDQNGKMVFDIKGGNYNIIGDCGNGYIFAREYDSDNVTVFDKSGNAVKKTFPTVSGKLTGTSWMSFSDSMLPYYEVDSNWNMKEGYLDTNFNIAIPAQYGVGYPFNDGLAFVTRDGKFGIIDKTGKLVVQPQFDDFVVVDFSYKVFSDGLACVMKNGKWGYIDTKGNTVIPFKYDECPGAFINGYATSIEYGCIDIDGKTVIPAEYDDINPPFNGVSLVGNGDKYYFIDTKGNKVSSKTWQLDYTYMSYEMVDAGLVFYRQNEKWGLAKITFAETTYTATPTTSKVIVNGDAVSFDAYNINGNNYFKLRDLAYVLSGSEKQFEVDWDGSAIWLTSGKAYTVIGGEMVGKGTGAKTATATTAKIYLDGKEVVLTAYNIGGNNYFKLRDIGQAFNFGVDWDGAASTITIDTSKGYTAE